MKCIQLIAANAGKFVLLPPLNLKLTEMLNKYTNLKNQKNDFLLLNKHVLCFTHSCFTHAVMGLNGTERDNVILYHMIILLHAPLKINI